VLFAALLHLGLVAFLLLATLSCNTFEAAINALGLPRSWNPVTCNKPTLLAGPVIEATLVGPSGAPSRASRARFPKPSAPPPPSPKQDQPKPVPIKTLPPPPKHPDTRDQQKVVALSTQKSKQALREQKARERQRMSELDAQQNPEIDNFFKQMDRLRQQSLKADEQARLQSKKLAQLDDQKHPKADAPTTAPSAEKARTGQAGTDQGLLAQYRAAIMNAVTQAWLRPDNIAEGTSCDIRIVQIRGGQVISAHVEPDCPFDAAARKSVENAVMRAAPLPYRGFESVFNRSITLHFMVKN
jgi:colicin import membrane protein